MVANTAGGGFNFTQSITSSKAGPVFPKLTLSSGYQKLSLQFESTGMAFNPLHKNVLSQAPSKRIPLKKAFPL